MNGGRNDNGRLLKLPRPNFDECEEESPDPNQSDAELWEILQNSYNDGLLLQKVIPTGLDDPAPSFLGGLPTLPADRTWPKTTDGSASMMFLAQIALDPLSDFSLRHRLPKKGALYFFIGYANDGDGYNRSAGTVLYDPRPVSAAAFRVRPADQMSYFDGDPPPRGKPAPASQDGQLYFQFPKWQVRPTACRFFRDNHPFHPSGTTGSRYQQLWTRVQSAELIRALGLPRPRQDVLKSLGVSPATDTFNDPREILFPDSRWPYTWLYVKFFCEAIADRLQHPRWNTQGEIAYLSNTIVSGIVHEQRYQGVLEHYKKTLGEAQSWIGASVREGYEKQIDGPTRNDFQTWAQGIRASCLWLNPDFVAHHRAFVTAPREIPPWKGEYGPQHALFRDRIQSSLAVATHRATHVLLGHFPASRIFIPAAIIDMLAPELDNLSDDGSRWTRHQLLGPPLTRPYDEYQFARDHVLLAQFDSDAAAAMEWPHGGALQYWVPRDELKVLNFDNVKVECSHP
jgi:uncharacterized protein YwqG